QAFTSCPQTLAAHATMLTGLQPPEHGLRINGKQRLGAGIPTLAETLAARGYRTGAFVAAFVLDSKFGLNRGFETYDEDLSHAVPQAVHERLSVYRPGNQVVDAALGWLEKAAAGPAPFFCWVHLYDPHYPDFAHDAFPGVVRAGARVDAMVSLVDLAPTVLEVLGIPAPARFSGRSLLPVLTGKSIESLPSYAETQLPYSVYRWSPLTSLTTPDWKYIRSPRAEVYARPSDRRELFNLASARPERVKDLEAQLGAMEAKMV